MRLQDLRVTYFRKGVVQPVLCEIEHEPSGNVVICSGASRQRAYLFALKAIETKVSEDDQYTEEDEDYERHLRGD